MIASERALYATEIMEAEEEISIAEVWSAEGRALGLLSLNVIGCSSRERRERRGSLVNKGLTKEQDTTSRSALWGTTSATRKKGGKKRGKVDRVTLGL
jgi:hypothetical protein